jgi:hypothetical protein
VPAHLDNENVNASLEKEVGYVEGQNVVAEYRCADTTACR